MRAISLPFFKFKIVGFQPSRGEGGVESSQQIWSQCGPSIARCSILTHVENVRTMVGSSTVKQAPLNRGHAAHHIDILIYMHGLSSSRRLAMSSPINKDRCVALGIHHAPVHLSK